MLQARFSANLRVVPNLRWRSAETVSNSRNTSHEHALPLDALLRLAARRVPQSLFFLYLLPTRSSTWCRRGRGAARVGWRHRHQHHRRGERDRHGGGGAGRRALPTATRRTARSPRSKITRCARSCSRRSCCCAVPSTECTPNAHCGTCKTGTGPSTPAHANCLQSGASCVNESVPGKRGRLQEWRPCEEQGAPSKCPESTACACVAPQPIERSERPGGWFPTEETQVIFSGAQLRVCLCCPFVCHNVEVAVR